MGIFKVIGDRAVLDHLPGERFEAELEEHVEKLLTDAGHIKRVKAPVETATVVGPVETATTEG